MEISIDRTTLYAILVLVALLSLLGLGALGRPLTPVTEDGNARLLSWSDWQLFKAERRYQAERNVLRSDADALAALLDQPADPVAAQLLAGRIARHTTGGETALAPARTALQQAAQDAVSWSAGVLGLDSAIASLQAASDLLK